MKYSNAFSSQIKLTIKVSAFSKKYSWGFWCISRSSLGSCIWCCCGCGRRCCYCVTGDLFLLCQKKTFIPQKIHLYFLQQILRLISCSPYASFRKGLKPSGLFDLNFRPKEYSSYIFITLFSFCLTLNFSSITLLLQKISKKNLQKLN